MIKVAVFGAKGRMGTAVCQAVEEAEDTELVAAVDSGGDRSDASGADVIVDFTTPDAVMDNLSWAISHDINTVVGTTGFDDELFYRRCPHDALRRAGRKVLRVCGDRRAASPQ